MSAIVILGAGGFAQAQTKPPVGPPGSFIRTHSIEDGATGNFLVFNEIGGSYTFTRCSDGFTVSGVGAVKVDGCMISLEDAQPDRRVLASLNECAQEGKAVVEGFDPAPFLLALNDRNSGNNSLACQPIPSRQNISVEDDATGSVLVFDRIGGKYTFTRCSDGFTINGVGVVKVDGCSISLVDTQADHRVVASVNECAQKAQALVETFDAAPFKLFSSDDNIGNNLMACAAKIASKK